MIGIRRTRSAAPLRSGTGGVFRQKRKYYPKDGAIFLLFVVVSGERTMLHTGAEQREENRYYTVVLVHTHTHTLVHCVHTHSRVGRSVGVARSVHDEGEMELRWQWSLTSIVAA